MIHADDAGPRLRLVVAVWSAPSPRTTARWGGEATDRVSRIAQADRVSHVRLLSTRSYHRPLDVLNAIQVGETGLVPCNWRWNHERVRQIP